LTLERGVSCALSLICHPRATVSRRTKNGPQWATPALQRMISLYTETESRPARGGHDEE
jgi:hypothetical protein